MGRQFGMLSLGLWHMFFPNDIFGFVLGMMPLAKSPILLGSTSCKMRCALPFRETVYYIGSSRLRINVMGSFWMLYMMTMFRRITFIMVAMCFGRCMWYPYCEWPLSLWLWCVFGCRMWCPWCEGSLSLRLWCVTPLFFRFTMLVVHVTTPPPTERFACGEAFFC